MQIIYWILAIITILVLLVHSIIMLVDQIKTTKRQKEIDNKFMEILNRRDK